MNKVNDAHDKRITRHPLHELNAMKDDKSHVLSDTPVRAVAIGWHKPERERDSTMFDTRLNRPINRSDQD